MTSRPTHCQVQGTKTWKHISTQTCTQMSLEALFTIAPNCKYPSPKQVSTPGEWMNNMWYKHMMEHYSTRENRLLILETTQKNLKNSTWREKADTRTHTDDFIYVKSVRGKTNLWWQKSAKKVQTGGRVLLEGHEGTVCSDANTLDRDLYYQA